jgi:hypothetical protein
VLEGVGGYFYLLTFGLYLRELSSFCQTRGSRLQLEGL